MTDASQIDALTEVLGSEGTVLRSLLEHVPAGVLIARAPDGPVVFTNAEARRILPPDHHPDALPLLRAMREGAVIEDEVLEVELGDGSRRLLSFSATPVRDSENAVVAAIAFFTDITERARRERAERDFITNAAHELQTPIAAIVSAIDVLQAGAKHRAADRNRFLAHIESAVARLERLTRALLVLARAESADEAVRREVVVLRPLLHSIAAGAGPRSRVAVRCPSDIATIANRELLEQTLVNLVENALHHGGRNPVTIAAERSDGEVLVEVRDEGPGIPEAERELVFKRFYRGDGGGFGVGLSIVRDSVHAMGGTVALDSSSSGTVVSVRLPAARMVKQ